MGDAWRNPPRRSAADDLLRILSTSISIFDSAITLLGEPSSGGVQMPGPAHIACIRNILSSLGVGEDKRENSLLS